MPSIPRIDHIVQSPRDAGQVERNDKRLEAFP